MNQLRLSTKDDHDIQQDNNQGIDVHIIYLESDTDSSESFHDIASTQSPLLLGPTTDPSTEISTPIFTEQSFYQTWKTLFLTALPFCTSRLAVAVQGIGYAYLMGQFGHLAISAGPLISGLQNAVVMPLRSGLAAINVLVPSMQQPRHIGRLVQQTYASTVVLTVPTVAILFNAGAMLRAMGTDSAVAAEVQRYMTGYIWGILPIYNLVVDQQFSLAIGKRGVATAIGLLYAALVLVSGYVLTTYVPGDLHQNTYGLGLGFSVGAWLLTLSLKVFFMLHPDYQVYQLFNSHHFMKNIRSNIANMFSIAVPMWLQSLSESFNLMVISILMSRISNDELMAEQVSLQWMTALSPVILALANVTCSMSSKLFGMYSRSILQTAQHTGTVTQYGQEEQMRISILQQLSRQVLASALLAGSIGVIFASLFLSIPRALTRLFVPTSGDSLQNQAIEALSTSMLRTNSLGVLADSCRLTLTGHLLGIRDASVPAIVSFLLISGLGLLIGAIGTEIFGLGGDSLFIVRNVFIIAATLAITARWFICRSDLHTAATQSLPKPRAVILGEHQTLESMIINDSDADLEPVLPPTNARLTQYGSFFSAPTVRQIPPVTASCCIC